MRPVPWRDDPDCGHDVAQAFQTHYCTYIRTPRLLTLQSQAAPADLLLLTAHQWYELWFSVLRADLEAAVAGDGTTYEPIKLLRRGSELLRLFDLHADLVEPAIVRGLGLARPLSDGGHNPPSAPLEAILGLSRRLPRLAKLPYPGLAAAAEDYTARLRSFRARYQGFTRATLPAGGETAPSYAEWLRLPELLALQEGVKSAWTPAGQAPQGHWAPEDVSADERMFIVVHQAFEVWFKVMLDQIDRAVPALFAGDIPVATALVRRVGLVQRLLVAQIQIPATMLPLDFMRFRDMAQERDGQVLKTGLTPASGTESYQFREIEIVSGLRDDPVFQKYLAGSDKLPIRLLTPRQRERLREPTLPEAFRHALRQRGVERLDAVFSPSDVPNPNMDLAVLADALLEFDEFFRFWRQSHVSMVEKMIGARSGTGFLGPEYLSETAGIRLQQRNRIFEDSQVRPRFFEELWEVRGRLAAL